MSAPARGLRCLLTAGQQHLLEWVGNVAAHARALELGPVTESISGHKKLMSVLDYRGDKPRSFWPKPASLTCTQPSRCAESEKGEQDIRGSLQAL